MESPLGNFEQIQKQKKVRCHKQQRKEMDYLLPLIQHGCFQTLSGIPHFKGQKRRGPPHRTWTWTQCITCITVNIVKVLLFNLFKPLLTYSKHLIFSHNYNITESNFSTSAIHWVQFQLKNLIWVIRRLKHLFYQVSSVEHSLPSKFLILSFSLSFSIWSEWMNELSEFITHWWVFRLCICSLQTDCDPNSMETICVHISRFLRKVASGITGNAPALQW